MANNHVVTSPNGLWEFSQLIGASVRIKSTAVSSGFFGYDSDSVYTISDVKFRMSQYGKCHAEVILEEFPGKCFVWKDLEIVELPFYVFSRAIAGQFCCGMTLCGYMLGSSTINTSNSSSSDDDLVEGESSDGDTEGDILD